MGHVAPRPDAAQRARYRYKSTGMICCKPATDSRSDSNAPLPVSLICTPVLPILGCVAGIVPVGGTRTAGEPV